MKNRNEEVKQHNEIISKHRILNNHFVDSCKTVYSVFRKTASHASHDSFNFSFLRFLLPEELHLKTEHNSSLHILHRVILFVENFVVNVHIMKINGTNRLQVSPPGPDLVPSNFERDLGLARAHMSIGDLCSCSAKQA